jgi:hypothetical protein
MREFLSRVQWLPVAVVVVGLGAVGVALADGPSVEGAGVLGLVALAWAVLARE